MIFSVGNYIAFFFYHNERLSLGPMIVGISFPILMLLVICFFVVRAPPKKVVAPWTNLEMQESSGTYIVGDLGGAGSGSVGPPSAGQYIADQRIPGNDSLPREASEDALRGMQSPPQNAL